MWLFIPFRSVSIAAAWSTTYGHYLSAKSACQSKKRRASFSSIPTCVPTIFTTIYTVVPFPVLSFLLSLYYHKSAITTFLLLLPFPSPVKKSGGVSHSWRTRNCSWPQTKTVLLLKLYRPPHLTFHFLQFHYPHKLDFLLVHSSTTTAAAEMSQENDDRHGQLNPPQAKASTLSIVYL